MNMTTCIRWTVLAPALLFCALGSPARAEVDFGDHGSATLTTKAWAALAQQAYDDGLAYVDKCIALYEGEAAKMQASLSDYPPSEPKEETFKYWALNDVGTCYFIKGEILRQKADVRGAKESYEKCMKNFAFAQCWDTKGWFWKPADGARQKLVELEFDEAK